MDLDDVIDMALAGGYPDRRRTKLTREKVLKIRKARAEGAPLAAIAEAANVCQRTVRDVLTRKTWKHVL